MAQIRHVEQADTNEVVVYAGRSYLTGVYITNFAGTATDAWLRFYDESGTTPTSTAPDVCLYLPWSADTGRRTYRFAFPNILFSTGIEMFYSDTMANSTSAWHSGGGTTGYEIVVYFTPLA